MCAEVLDFVLKSNLDWHLVDDVFLSPVNDTNVAELQVNLFIQQHLFSTGSLVHNIDLSDNTDCPLAVLIPLSGEF